jgi:DNA-binding Lrp family transcriptional regulator
MAISAYVFIESAVGKAAQVAEAAARLPGVKMIHAVTGAYDVIAFVEAADLLELGALLSDRIHRLPGVLKTTTNVVVEEGRASKPARRP